jgi:RNA polymerase sigma-70 factor (ECF subfamily)
VTSITTTSTDESDLIRKILGGQKDLFADLITPHLRPLRRTVRATLGSHPDIEDIVQQTSLLAFTHLEQFRSEASFRTWLIRIGLNEARGWRRKLASSRFVALDLLSPTQLAAAEARHSPLVESERSEAIVRLRSALAQLPEKYRSVIVLRDFEELSLSEVAQRLGLTIPGVKTRQSRARQRIAKFLERLNQSQPQGPACR